MKHNLCKALCALSGDAFVERRRPIIKPVMTTILGIVLCTLPHVADMDLGGSLAMLLMVVGISGTLVGAVMLAIRIFGSATVPYDVKAGRYMSYRERYYDRVLLSSLMKAIERGDTEAIDQLPTTNIAAITLAEYRTPGGKTTMYAVYEYAEDGNRELLAPRIIERK